jgi:hypothetical protein
MTRKELIYDVKNAFEQLSKMVGTTMPFDYWIAKNLSHAISYAKINQKKLDEINIKNSVKNSIGQPKTEKNRFGGLEVVIDNQELYDLDIKNYFDSLESQATEFNIHKLKQSEWELNKREVNGITAEHYLKLMEFIEDDTTTKTKIKKGQ